jgi:hypothetical protein
MLGPGTAHAVDGTWQGPGAEWTAGTNWSSSPTVPDGTATFSNTGPTSVTISNSTSIDTIAFGLAAPAYSFTVQSGGIIPTTFTITNQTSNSSSFLPAFSVNSGATMTLGDGAFAEIESLAGGGNVVVGPSDSSTTLIIAGSTSTTFSGKLSGAGTLEIDGGAVLTLTGQGNTSAVSISAIATPTVVSPSAAARLPSPTPASARWSKAELSPSSMAGRCRPPVWLSSSLPR